MTRWLALILSLLSLPFASEVSADGAGVTVIFGGDLPHAVQLAAADEDAFFRRLDPPPELAAPPTPSGPAYLVSSSYWDLVLRKERDERPPEEVEALYYPEGGLVRAHRGGEDVWLLLNQRQRAILNRYIRLARAGLFEEYQLGVLEVLAASAAQGELIGVEAGGKPFSEAQAQALWQALLLNPRPDLLEPRQPPTATAPGFWLVFTLLEGRSVQLFYGAPAGLPVLTDYLGSERYPVSPPLDAAIRAVQPEPPRDVKHEQGRGSSLWWPVMVGGGLALLGAAVWMRRRAS